MARLLDTGSGLVIGYPSWLLLIAVAGAALLAYVARPGAAKVKGRWQLAVVSLLMLFAGVWFYTWKVTLTPESARVYSFLIARGTLGELRWPDARRAEVLMRERGRGGPKPFLVLWDAAQRELEIPLGALDPTDREKVVKYVRERVESGRH